MSDELKQAIRTMALAHGFDTVGFTQPSLPEAARSGLSDFLEQQHHGTMGWMEANRERRSSPADIWPDVQSIIVVGHNYGPEHNPLTSLNKKENAVISVYALGDDYHDVIKKKLKALAHAIAAQFGGDARVFVDTAPVMEKPLAQQAGLGWQGKHTCLVSREFGSWLFLGEIFTSIAIAPDEADQDHCGNCSRCLDICPTNAFPAPGKIDARKCISYLTIEHKGHIDSGYRKAMGNRIYGCDDCLAVCPWNKFAQATQEIAYHPRGALTSPLLGELALLDDAQFRAMFSKSPIKRIGRDRFVRNVAIALGNSGNRTHISLLEGLAADASSLVRAMAAWALNQLLTREEWVETAARFMSYEQDEAVQREWKGI